MNIDKTLKELSEIKKIKNENDNFKEYLDMNDFVKEKFDKWLYNKITYPYYKEILEG